MALGVMMMTRFRISAPGRFRDRLDRIAVVECRAKHNLDRWLGVAGDGDPACWKDDGVIEGSLPSAIDIIRPELTRV
jgi:hypothetical protein